MSSISYVHVKYVLIVSRSLLIGSLQLLLAVCSHRGRSILEELNVETLGKDPVESEEKSTILKSFKAVLMPRNEVKIKFFY